MSGTPTAGGDTSGPVSPFLRAHAGWGLHPAVRTDTTSDAILSLPVVRICRPTPHQQRQISRGSQYANAQTQQCSHSFGIGAARFEIGIAPSIGDLVRHTERSASRALPIRGRDLDPLLRCGHASHPHRSGVSDSGIRGAVKPNRGAYGSIS